MFSTYLMTFFPYMRWFVKTLYSFAPATEPLSHFWGHCGATSQNVYPALQQAYSFSMTAVTTSCSTSQHKLGSHKKHSPTSITTGQARPQDWMLAWLDVVQLLIWLLWTTKINSALNVWVKVRISDTADADVLVKTESETKKLPRLVSIEIETRQSRDRVQSQVQHLLTHYL